MSSLWVLLLGGGAVVIDLFLTWRFLLKEQSASLRKSEAVTDGSTRAGE